MILEQLIFTILAFGIFVYMFLKMFKENDTVKAKIMNIGEDGKISLSIKRALPPQESTGESDNGRRREKRPAAPPKPDNSYTWAPKKTEPASFEEMMNRFKQTSDEKFSDLKRKNPNANRTKRGTGVR